MPAEKNDNPSPSPKKHRWMTFRSLDDDEEVITAKADKTDLSLSEYMRRMCRDGEIIINQRTALSYAEIDQVRRHGYNIMHLLKEYRTRGHPLPGNLEALFDVQQRYYKLLLDAALSEEPV